MRGWDERRVGTNVSLVKPETESDVVTRIVVVAPIPRFRPEPV